ncbi:LamG domain-containing protein, partial [Streptomyces sp. TRM76130]|nr:LamG domain-containing protein [Streptomyces sp. TRM76130]
GARMDGRARLTGAVDDVRVWRRALSDGEVGAAEPPAGDSVLWLPLDRVDAAG